MKTKLCTKCDKVKELSEFSIDKNRKDGVFPHCKLCKKDYMKIWRKNNRRKIKDYQKKNKVKSSNSIRNYYLEFPWLKVLVDLNQRCNNPKNNDYKNYGGRGIKNLLSKENIQVLWFRDKAYNMKKPSIDRKDNDGNYEFDNCEFIEMPENSAKDKRKAIIQLDLAGIFIKEWYCIRDAEKQLKINHSNISHCLKGKGKTCGGFKWRYKNEN